MLKIRKLVITLALFSVLILLGLPGCLANAAHNGISSTVGAITVESEEPQDPSSLPLATTNLVIGLTRAQIEKMLGPSKTLPENESHCRLPLVETDTSTGKVTATTVIGKSMFYEFTSKTQAWSAERRICILNTTAVTDSLKISNVQNGQYREAVWSAVDFNLIREIFWGQHNQEDQDNDSGKTFEARPDTDGYKF